MSEIPTPPKWDRELNIGDVVIWHDSRGKAHNALVICVFPAWNGVGLLNLLIVSDDPKREDSYGRQFERETSCMHKSQTNVHGGYWRYTDEEPNPYVAPEKK